MKMILAMIEPQKLKEVRRSLSDIGIYNMTVSAITRQTSTQRWGDDAEGRA